MRVLVKKLYICFAFKNFTTIILKKDMHTHNYSITEAQEQNLKPSSSPRGKWVKEMWYIYVPDCCWVMKNNFQSLVRKGVDLKIIMLSKISHSQKVTYHKVSLI